MVIILVICISGHVGYLGDQEFRAPRLMTSLLFASKVGPCLVGYGLEVRSNRKKGAMRFLSFGGFTCL
jgi:hypothetical protein